MYVHVATHTYKEKVSGNWAQCCPRSTALAASVTREYENIFTGVDQRSVCPVSKTGRQVDSQESVRTGQPYMTHVLTVLLISGWF